jgi:ubiquinone/menaquinone biosynthesis C-methylase UbiE
MRKRTLLAGLAAGLGIAAWRLAAGRPHERIVSTEALDDPEVVQGYLQVADMPHMSLAMYAAARYAIRGLRASRALDVGCGPGRLAIGLAQRVPGLQVVGLDLSQEMLDLAQARAERAGIAGRMQFWRGDAQQTPFPDDHFDLVVSTLSLHHWNHPVTVLDEMARLARPGGRVVVFDLRRDMAVPAWLLVWLATHIVVPPALRRIGEPLRSRDAAYTPQEAVLLARQSALPNPQVRAGRLWLIVESDIPTNCGEDTGWSMDLTRP